MNTKTEGETVLRPWLYSRIKAYARGNVRVINGGVPNHTDFIDDPSAKLGKRLNSMEYGETYVTHCPYCGDTRWRLYINHMWGYQSEVTGTMNWWLIKCFNEEDCFADYERRLEFYHRLSVDTYFGLTAPQDILVKVSPKKHINQLSKAILPGNVTNLNRLVPSHPARLYLESRDFDPDELARTYDLSYCHESLPEFSMALNRIIIPIYKNSELVGWQARILGDSRGKSVPKYYTMPGMRKSQILYNLDNAKQYPYAVLVEGPSDVWRYGPEAVATLGCNISTTQQELLIKHFKAVVILLDGDANAASQDIFQKLRSFMPNVFRLVLKENDDPGSKSTEYLRNIVEKTFDNFRVKI